MPELTTEEKSAKGRSNRRSGDQHARNAVAYLKKHGFPDARRELITYNSDVRGTDPLAIECKYTTWQHIPEAVDQANRDAGLRQLPRGVVIKKRQGIDDIGQGFWIGTVAAELAAAVRLIELEARVTELEALLTAAVLPGRQDSPAAPAATFRPPHPEGLPF